MNPHIPCHPSYIIITADIVMQKTIYKGIDSFSYLKGAACWRLNEAILMKIKVFTAAFQTWQSLHPDCFSRHH